MTIVIHLMLAVLLLTGTVLGGNWPGVPQRPSSVRYLKSHFPSQMVAFSRQQAIDINQPRQYQITSGFTDMSAADSEAPSSFNNNYNNDDNDYSSPLCSAEDSMRWFCQEENLSDQIAFGRRLNTIDYFTNKNNVVLNPTHNNKRFDSQQVPLSNCNCRSRSLEMSHSKPINLGNDHYPQYLPINVTCDQSLCSEFSYCKPTTYEIKVLIKRRNNQETMDDNGLLPQELRHCWRSKKYTVFTDCMCVTRNNV